MKLINIIAGHLLVLVLAFPQPVAAEEFIMNIGVDLTKLHEDVSKVRIVCNIRKGSQGVSFIATGAREVDVPANGVLNRTVTLKFNSPPGVTVDVNAVMNYICRMTFKPSGFESSGTSYTALSPNSGSCSGGGLASNAWRCTLPGTQLIGVLTGLISPLEQ